MLDSGKTVIGRLGRKLRIAIVSAVVAVGALGGAVALPAAPALAGGCSAGTWGGVYGWGDCRSFGTRKWQLKVSCTWGQSSTSSVMTGDGHVDVRCPWGTAAQYASIIYR